MKRPGRSLIAVLWLVATVMLCTPDVVAETPLLVDPDGGSVQWSRWLEENGPAAVLVWASWVPEAATAKAAIPELATICTERKLDFVVIDVQETLADARTHLQSLDTRWLHDRHGAILKLHRVTWVPQVLVLDRDGELLARLHPTAAALRGWRSP